MQKNDWWKWLVLVAAIAFSAFLVTPWKDKVRFGLDIKGGYSFTLQIDEEALREVLKEREPELSEEALEDKVRESIKNADEVAAEIIRNRIDPLGTEEPVITRGKDRRIYVQLPGADEAKRQAAERSVRSVAYLAFHLVHVDNDRLVHGLFAAGKAPEGYRITTRNNTEYYEPDPNYTAMDRQSEEFKRKLSRFETPDRAYVCMLEHARSTDKETLYKPIYVMRRPEKVEGSDIKNARAVPDDMNRPSVVLTFNLRGAKDFERVTAKYCPNGEMNKGRQVGRQLAIVLDGTVYSAPVIKDRIGGGVATISGSFSLEEAEYLKTVLNAGALPAPLKFMGQRFVAPTLGDDAIRGTINAITWGVLAIVIFMMVYYRYCGVVANVAFLLDLVLLPIGAVIVSNFFGLLVPEARIAGGGGKLPVLTLPGVAGLLLTLGMAVDANVLIFERIREELRAGKRLFTAIHAGYDRAFLSIFDSNITTALTAVILFVFGSGLIRGFAVMLTAGIIVSMFNVLVVTKLIFKATVPETSSKTFKMMMIWPEGTKVDFMGKFKPYLVAAVAIAVVTLGIGIAQGLRDPSKVFAVDFTGGAKISYEVADTGKAPTEDVRATLARVGVTDATPQYQVEGSRNFLEFKTVHSEINGEQVDKVLTDALHADFPEAGFKYLDADTVGAQIGGEMKRSATIAVLLALAGMILYLTLRFEFGFALGALVALVHDVLIVLGIYLASGRQVSLITVAAMLTIVGYSINDTIVIFDRIREELKLDQRADVISICNRCINTTMSRTILTSLTTLITTLALLIFSKGEIRDFAFTMALGIVFGTLSTIFIATPVMLAVNRGRRPTFGKS